LAVFVLILLAAAASCGAPPGGAEDSTAASGPADAPAAPSGGPWVRVLGTVQDGGFPHAACSCERCETARRDPGRARWISSLALVLPEADEVYLVDATPDIREQLADLQERTGRSAGRMNRGAVDGVLLTHAHIGHYLGLAFFGFEAIHTEDLPVYCTPRMAQFLRSNGPWDQLMNLHNIALQEIAGDEPFTLGDRIEVTPVAAPHRDEYADTIGFLFKGPSKSLFYISDTDGWPGWDPPITEWLAHVDIAILDGTFYSDGELPGRDASKVPHPRITATMDLLQPLVDAGALKVFLTHLNHSNPALDPDSPERREMESRGFKVLEEGQEFSL
jgi:pyrroloquinoline quinone biosynthesis protein B